MTAEEAVRSEHQRQGMTQVSVANAITQPAAVLGDRLARVRRAREPRRARAAARSRRRLQRGWTFSAATSSATRSSRSPRRTGKRRCSWRCAPSRARAQAAARGSIERPRGARRLSPGRARPPRARGRRRLSAAVRHAHPAARARRIRRCCISASIAGVTAGARRRWSCGPRRTRGFGRAARRSRSPCWSCRRSTSRSRSSSGWSPGGSVRAGCSGSTSPTACRRRADDGRRADAARQRRGRGGAARAPRSARARQPRSAHPLRDPRRLRRCADRGARGGRTDSRRPPAKAFSISIFDSARATPIASSCFIASAAGIRASASGWAGSASAARSTSSTGCCAARRTPRSSRRSATSSVLPHVRYCITLDTDTRLPRDAAKSLIGIIAHPLNQPRDRRAQPDASPRATPSCSRASASRMASAAGSLFARLYAGHTGVDPYTTAVSDTYQDLFDEGIFTGKGLYDVDAFVGVAARPRAGQHAALARSVRGTLRPDRARDRCRSRRRLSVERARARQTAAPLGARRLADPVLAAAVRADPRRLAAQPTCR